MGVKFSAEVNSPLFQLVLCLPLMYRSVKKLCCFIHYPKTCSRSCKYKQNFFVKISLAKIKCLVYLVYLPYLFRINLGILANFNEVHNIVFWILVRTIFKHRHQSGRAPTQYFNYMNVFAYTPCLKKAANLFFFIFYNFAKFRRIVKIFGTKIAERTGFSELYSFSTSPNLCQHTTV